MAVDTLSTKPKEKMRWKLVDKPPVLHQRSGLFLSSFNEAKRKNEVEAGR